jgi:hypothetical protein
MFALFHEISQNIDKFHAQLLLHFLKKLRDKIEQIKGVGSKLINNVKQINSVKQDIKELIGYYFDQQHCMDN